MNSNFATASPDEIRLSVVIPVYNEGDNIVELVREVIAALSGLGAYEILVVDDGSSDATVARVQAVRPALGAPLRLLRHRRNAGQSTALLTGVRAARAPWVATLDGDGQNDPADLPALWALIGAAGSDLTLVCGQRVDRHDDWLRRWSSRIANAVRSRLLRDSTPDTGCGLKLVRRDAYLRLPYFDHMHRFLPALIQQGGGRCRSVPVRHRPRRHGKSNYGVGNRLWVGLVDLAGVLWLARRNRHVDHEEIPIQ